MHSIRVLVLVLLSFTGCRSAGYANLPIASAMLVHVCAVKEVQMRLFSGIAGSIDSYEIKLNADSKNSAKLGGGYDSYINAEINSDKGASKEVTITISSKAIDALALDDCYAKGYLHQLGANGCLLKSRNPDVCSNTAAARPTSSPAVAPPPAAP